MQSHTRLQISAPPLSFHDIFLIGQRCHASHSEPRIICFNFSFQKTWQSEHSCFGGSLCRHSLGVVVEQVDQAVGFGSVNVDEEGQVHHHGQGEQQHLHVHARPDEHDHPQHGQQAAVQVVLGTDGRV